MSPWHKWFKSLKQFSLLFVFFITNINLNEQVFLLGKTNNSIHQHVFFPPLMFTFIILIDVFLRNEDHGSNLQTKHCLTNKSKMCHKCHVTPVSDTSATDTKNKSVCSYYQLQMIIETMCSLFSIKDTSIILMNQPLTCWISQME